MKILSKSEFDLILRVIARDILPSDIFFYETDGKVLFELRGASGGITTRLIFYLIKESGEDVILSFPVEINFQFLEYAGFKLIEKLLIKSLVEFQNHIQNSTAKIISKNGGDLGRAYVDILFKEEE